MKIGSLVRFSPALRVSELGELFMVIGKRPAISLKSSGACPEAVKCVSVKTGKKTPFVRTTRLSVYA